MALAVEAVDHCIGAGFFTGQFHVLPVHVFRYASNLASSSLRASSRSMAHLSSQKRPSNQQNTSQTTQIATATTRNVNILRRRASTNRRAASSSM